ncbi:MAG: class I tRNA ligase family protein [Nanoarchaeota archaeon]
MINNTIIKYDFGSIEDGWVVQWEKDQIYSADVDHSKPKFYCLDTWPYPSAEGVHIGYVKSFCGMDIIARYKRMKGFNVLYPMGWDTLGLPAENYAIKSGRHPREITDESIKNYKKQFMAFALSYDWKREINTADTSYYKWTQWLFLIMFKNGLAYRKKSAVNWCPSDKTVLANEQVVDGKCERCGAEVIQRELMQWFFKVTDYADRLYEDCSKLDWSEKYLNIHKKWIGKKVKNGKTTFHLRDWSIARQRYWGPPIPIVYCEKCGTVPVAEKDLPVILPYDVDFTPTGEPPLAKKEDFVNTTCPSCGGSAKREVDVLDTFVSSAWYQFRFPDPKNDKDFVSKEVTNYWQNVDHYEGTIEHLTAHLIYARFVTKVLFDKGFLNFDEPFPKYTPVGLLVDKTGTKFSKRLGNSPDTNELIKKYGGDLLRLSCFFITPFDDVSRWGEQDIIGVKKFRDRVWRVFQEKVDGKNHSIPEQTIRNLHQMIKDVEENIEQMKFNVAISRMMEFVNEMMGFEGKISKEIWENFTKVLAPFAPFISEEMWRGMNHDISVHLDSWPIYNSELITSNVTNISVQINGRPKGRIETSIGATQEQVESVVYSNSKFDKFLVEKASSIVFVPGKVISFVTK